MARNYVPDTGDLVWTDFDPTRGREQAGRRPALVVSSALFAANTGLAVVCPITSRVRPFPTSVVLPSGLPITGEILTSHPQYRYERATDPLRGRKNSVRNRATSRRKAGRIHHDLVG